MNKAYKLEQFIPSQHFKDRALERFGVDEENLNNFIMENNEVFDSGLSPTSGRESTVSRKGNMFILDLKTNAIVTTYKSISPTIAEKKRTEFQSKLSKIIRESQVSTARDYLTEIKESIQRFYFMSMDLINSTDLMSEATDDYLKVEQIYKDMTIIRSTLNLLSKQTDFYEQHQMDYESKNTIEEPQKWQPTQSISLDEFKNSDYEIKTFDLNELPKTGLFNAYETIVEKQTETNLPEDYKQKVSNNELISDKDILKDYLEGPDRVIINNWFSKQGKSPLGSQVNKAIKSGYTQTQLESLVKSQLSIIHFNKFKNILKDTLKDAKNRKTKGKK